MDVIGRVSATEVIMMQMRTRPPFSTALRLGRVFTVAPVYIFFRHAHPPHPRSLTVPTARCDPLQHPSLAPFGHWPRSLEGHFERRAASRRAAGPPRRARLCRSVGACALLCCASKLRICMYDRPVLYSIFPAYAYIG